MIGALRVKIYGSMDFELMQVVLTVLVGHKKQDVSKSSESFGIYHHLGMK